MHEVWSQEPHSYRVLLDEKCLSCKTEVYLLLSIVQWELSLVWSSGFFNETVRSPFTQGHSGVFRLFGSLYFTVCKNRYTHSLIIPQYSVGSSAVKKAKRDGSFLSNNSGILPILPSSESLRLDLSFLKVFNRSQFLAVKQLFFAVEY